MVLIAFGALLTLVLGFWLVSDQDYSFSELWLVLSLDPLGRRGRAGQMGGMRDRQTRLLAERARGRRERADAPSCARACATRARSRSRTGAALVLVVVLALMVWKPGA